MKITCAESCSERISHLVSPQGGGMEILYESEISYSGALRIVLALRGSLCRNTAESPEKNLCVVPRFSQNA